MTDEIAKMIDGPCTLQEKERLEVLYKALYQQVQESGRVDGVFDEGERHRKTLSYLALDTLLVNMRLMDWLERGKGD